MSNLGSGKEVKGRDLEGWQESLGQKLLHVGMLERIYDWRNSKTQLGLQFFQKIALILLGVEILSFIYFLF